jgi:PPOX class probable F420-dependent enzyme
VRAVNGVQSWGWYPARIGRVDDIPMTKLPQLARDLLDGKNFASIATLLPDGSPQSSIVWIKRDGDDVLFSTIHGRRKTDNMKADPRISVLVTDAANGYRYAEIRGRVELTEDPDAELIEELALKYTGEPFGERPGQRVIVRVRPEHVVARDDE